MTEELTKKENRRLKRKVKTLEKKVIDLKREIKYGWVYRDGIAEIKKHLKNKRFDETITLVQCHAFIKIKEGEKMPELIERLVISIEECRAHDKKVAERNVDRGGPYWQD
jgi:hypothetical protein